MTLLLKKYSVLILILISVILMGVATQLYPGGSIFDKDSQGFIWTKNFISNLFEEKAINGSDNRSRIWALVAVMFHSVGYGLFFINSSKKIPLQSAARTLKYIGIATMLFDFLVATPLHDIMVAISSTLSLLGLFYITVFVMMTRLHFFKFFCIASMLLFYFTLFLYGIGNWALLAIMQKVSFVCSMLLVLSIEYFTRTEDFKHAGTKKHKLRTDD